MTALRWHDVTLRRRGRLILDRVSLSAAAGEVLGIVGPNGAGKTALLRCAVGLERLAGGAVEIAGGPVARMHPEVLARAAAFLPQQAELAWPITVEAAVALGRLPHRGGKPQDDCSAVSRALDAVGMGGLMGRSVTTLSGGERALVLLARALAVEAGVLLLDEPGAALDPHHQLAVMDLFRRLAREGRTVCVVLHDLSLAARYCDRIAVLHDGRLVADGTPETALTDSLLESVYAIRGVRARIDEAHLLLPWERLPSGRP